MSLIQIDPDGTGAFAKRALIAASLVMALVLFVGFVWYSTGLLLVIFSSILLALFLRGLSGWIEKKTGLSPAASLVVASTLLFLFCGLLAWLLPMEISTEAGALRRTLPTSIQSMREKMERSEWGRWTIQALQNGKSQISWRQFVYSKTLGVFSTTVGAFGGLAFAVVLGVYLAVEYSELVDGFVSLFPVKNRARCLDVLQALGHSLQLWLVSRFIAMIFVTVTLWPGLYAIGIPLAFPLAVLTGILTFVPNFGPVAAMIPVVLLALMQGPVKILYVLILYAAVYTVEGNVLTPLIQRQMLEIPVSILLAGQVLLGALFGGVGVAVAMPLNILVIVLVKKLYLEKNSEFINS